MSQKEKKALSVCIIGAGVGGLAIAKQLQDAHIDFQCYDARSKVGGIWAYTEDPSFTAAWARLNQNTPRGRYQFSDFPMPDSYPDYPTREEVQQYLQSYVQHFNFGEKIQLNTRVLSANRLPEGGWVVETSDNNSRYFDYLVVANGHHNKPNFPDYTKTSSFSGTSLHSGQYRQREVFQDKRVLVVGIGNSGSQIAVDVSHAAEKTFISTRRGVYILPHYICGLRFDKLFGFVEWWWIHKLLRWPILHWISTIGYKIFIAKNERFGLPTPDHKMFEALPTLSENFFNRIGDGRLMVKPEVLRTEANKVYFKDGTSEDIDAIIYSTGFNLEFPFFKVENLQFHENRVPLFKRIFSTQYPDVVFIGLFQAVTFGFLHMMEHQARLAARYIKGEYVLPSLPVMVQDIERERKHIEKTFTKVLRNNYQMMGSLYVKEIVDELKKGLRRAKQNRFKENQTGAVSSPTKGAYRLSDVNE